MVKRECHKCRQATGCACDFLAYVGDLLSQKVDEPPIRITTPQSYDNEERTLGNSFLVDNRKNAQAFVELNRTWQRQYKINFEEKMFKSLAEAKIRSNNEGKPDAPPVVRISEEEVSDEQPITQPTPTAAVSVSASSSSGGISFASYGPQYVAINQSPKPKNCPDRDEKTSKKSKTSTKSSHSDSKMEKSKAQKSKKSGSVAKPK